jgi:hypothetical protein
VPSGRPRHWPTTRLACLRALISSRTREPKIKEMRSRNLSIVLYIWLEKVLSRGDYRRVP